MSLLGLINSLDSFKSNCLLTGMLPCVYLLILLLFLISVCSAAVRNTVRAVIVCLVGTVCVWAPVGQEALDSDHKLQHPLAQLQLGTFVSCNFPSVTFHIFFSPFLYYSTIKEQESSSSKHFQFCYSAIWTPSLSYSVVHNKKKNRKITPHLFLFFVCLFSFKVSANHSDLFHSVQHTDLF